MKCCSSWLCRPLEILLHFSEVWRSRLLLQILSIYILCLIDFLPGNHSWVPLRFLLFAVYNVVSFFYAVILGLGSVLMLCHKMFPNALRSFNWVKITNCWEFCDDLEIYRGQCSDGSSAGWDKAHRNGWMLQLSGVFLPCIKSCIPEILQHPHCWNRL